MEFHHRPTHPAEARIMSTGSHGKRPVIEHQIAGRRQHAAVDNERMLDASARRLLFRIPGKETAHHGQRVGARRRLSLQVHDGNVD